MEALHGNFNRKITPKKRSCRLQTPIGVIYIEENGEAVTSLYIDNTHEERYYFDESDKKLQFLDEPASDLLETAGIQLMEYFQGKRKEFSIPLAPQGTEFQKKVWKALCTIPYGQTASYGEIATQIGNPKACRAVGGANNKNPIMIFIPCHRVIGADGSLVGFGGGLGAKRYMLDLEKGEK